MECALASLGKLVVGNADGLDADLDLKLVKGSGG